MSFQLAENLFFCVIKIIGLISETLNSSNFQSDKKSEIAIEHISRVLTLLDKIYQDEKISIGDTPDIIKVMRELFTFVNFDFYGAAHELANSSQANLKDLIKKFDDNFILSDKDKEKNIEELLDEILTIILSLGTIREIVNKITKK